MEKLKKVVILSSEHTYDYKLYYTNGRVIYTYESQLNRITTGGVPFRRTYG